VRAASSTLPDATTVQWSERDQFSRAGVDAFLRILGAALLACVVADALLGAWSVHGGELFPWRHVAGVPLYGRGMLCLEWALGGIAGTLLLGGLWCDVAIPLGLVATALGLSQRFSNHRALLFIVLMFVALAKIDRRGADFATVRRPALALVRAELLIVSASSLLNKVLHGFLTGQALFLLFGWARSGPLAWAVVGAELLVPLLLVFRARWGVAGAVLLHGSMAIVLPSVWPFSLTMIAMAILFLCETRQGQGILEPLSAKSSRNTSTAFASSD
jgi:hypothetical protein